MQILICDDDELFIQQLQRYIALFFKQRHLSCPNILSFTSGEKLLSYPGKIDILFLDIEMPGMNGIYIGNVLKQRNEKTIIFVVTSYSEYLDEAMRFHVFRYLSKPLEKRRLFRNLKDAISLYHSASATIAVETRHEVVMFPSSEIIAIEAVGRNVTVHTTRGDYVSIRNMQHWIETLPQSCFAQSHRSFIVNFQHVCSFNHDTIRLADGNLSAYLTKRKYTEFKNAYFLYLESRE
ncbi:MAG: LytTR family DNA-binding domain-containing protein [Eubacteriales bacterium]|nr:LytTR family DNA-binding domain-containing protein [Eubacteriales bacterium]